MVLICGLIIAVFVAIMEFVWSTRRTAETDEVNPHHHPPPPPLPLSSSSSCPAPGLSLSSNTSVGRPPVCVCERACDFLHTRLSRRHIEVTVFLSLSLAQVSVCQEMLTEFRNAVSCKKSSRSRRRRPLSSAGGGVLRHPSRLALAAPRPIRLVRDMRLSNGKLYSGSGPLTGAPPGLGLGGCPDLGPGPQRLLEDPLGVNATNNPASALVAPPAPPRSFLQACSHVRICQECRRIQSLRPATLTPPPPPPPSSSSSASSCSRLPPSAPAPGHHQRHDPHHHLHYHHGSMSLPRLPPPPPPIPADRADSDGGGGARSPRRANTKPPPPPRPLPPPKTPTRPPTDLLGGHN